MNGLIEMETMPYRGFFSLKVELGEAVNSALG